MDGYLTVKHLPLSIISFVGLNLASVVEFDTQELSYPKSVLSGMWMPMLAKLQQYGFPYSSSLFVIDDNANASVALWRKLTFVMRVCYISFYS